MVFLTAINLIRNRGPDPFWRKRKIFKLAAFFYGRRRNCYSLAIRSVHRALVYCTKGRDLRKRDIGELRNQRIEAGVMQYDPEMSRKFIHNLYQKDVQLNRKSLADLAAWEPSSFEALVKIAFTPMDNEDTKK